jgi:hypothetical protein
LERASPKTSPTFGSFSQSRNRAPERFESCTTDPKGFASLQALKIHPDFRGTYRLEWQGYRSRIPGIEDGPDQIAEALNAMFEGSTETRFEVTVAEVNRDRRPRVAVALSRFAASLPLH